MKNPTHSSLIQNRRTRRNRGFALVVTLTLLILLTVIAVALLSLSTISLRTSSQSSDMAAARANARMAMMLALGELQKTAGPDTRVTARADLIDENNSPVLGVWRSWEGKDHDDLGRPIPPDYSAHKEKRFLAWLASDPDNTNLQAPIDGKGSTGGKVTLLGVGSVGDTDADKRQVHLLPVKVSADKARGSYAWWVSGENQKARLPRPYAPSTDNPATWSVLAKSHATVDTEPFGLDELLTDPSLKDPALTAPANRAITLKGADLLLSTGSAGNKISRDYYHDLSVNSVGLLTNTATGGWRKDLSQAADNWASLTPSNALPMFRLSPETDLLYARPDDGTAMADHSLLYHWSSFRQGATENRAIWSFPAISSWANLVNYATLYKSMGSASATGVLSTAIRAEGIDQNVYNFAHKVRVLPLIARVQWVYSHVTKQNPSTGKYDLFLQVTPVVTLWNPYNVKITAMSNMRFRLEGSLPPVIDYRVNGASLTFPAPDNGKTLVTLQRDNIAGTTATLAKGLTTATEYEIASIPAFGPGETRVFSPSADNDTLIAGYRAGKGSKYLVAENVGTGQAELSTAVTFDSEFADKSVGVGLYLNMTVPVVAGGPARTLLAYRMSYDKESAKIFYPKYDAEDFLKPTLLEAIDPVPFLLVTFGARMASNTFLPSKGFVQSSPFVNYTAMGQKGPLETTINYSYPGSNHNVNSPFEYSFTPLLAGDQEMPGADPTTNGGYILTGFTSAKGLSRCVISEIPGRPLASLGELQNWDARYENPVPPFSFNLVGNSDASPLMPSNAVVRSAEVNSKGSENLQHDDSYCLNHVLFDDWFCSSIAPEPSAFGQPSISSSSKAMYASFLKDSTKPLANRAYKPIAQDANEGSVSSAAATALAGENLNTTTSWKTIASRLEVEGMFNVNSTSVKAWRALLGHARNQRTPFTGSNGSPKISGEENYAVSRFSVAGDAEASQSGSSGALPASAEYAGYRVFSDDQLDFLAEQIVEQVRKRGPFLSLSEFVNRQLSSGDLAMAGAIQTALNELTNSSKNPFGELQTNTNYSSESPPSPPGKDAGYVNSQAAVGSSLYGIPGWTRQADILRPIAPILSARDDTFTIRAYGDSRDVTGNTIKAHAVCEVTVRRSREFVDTGDDAALATLSTNGSVPTLKKVNQDFGRRFEIISFRWLSSNEV